MGPGAQGDRCRVLVSRKGSAVLAGRKLVFTGEALAVKGCEVRRGLIRAAGNYVNVFGFLRNLLGVMIGGRMAEGTPT